MSTRAERRDTVRGLGLVLGGALAATLPRRFDRPLTSVVASLATRRPGRVHRLAARMAQSLGDPDSSTFESAARDHYHVVAESAWARAKAQRARAWRPEVEVMGLERLDEARERGLGAILWRLSFCSTLVVKIGIWRAEVPIVHLSREEHGADSGAWAARTWVAPRYRRCEDPYLAERVVIPREGSPVPAMRRLLECLGEQNAVISIVGDLAGSQPVVVPFFDAQAALATGAPSLAAKTGAALLPTYAVWLGPGRYRVVIEEPIRMDASLDRRSRIEDAVSAFARRAEGAIRSHPASWMVWGRFWGGHEPFRRLPNPSASP